MPYQMTFKRYELKYKMNWQQKENILQSMNAYMKPDQYGRTTIRNIYYDTDTYRLIRRSLENPAYKEKLRVRSYCPANGDTPVFVELKKKYQHVVYKRRLVCPQAEVLKYFGSGNPLPDHSQIGNEIRYFWQYYKTLHPAVFLSYEREAYYALDGSDLRVTFDENILYREKDLNLGSAVYGTPILEEGQTLMEIKTSGGIPLWMSRALTGNHLYKTSFSKYGTAYQQMQAAEKIQGGIRYA
ncbi:MAG: polyphosphate polymerase domain-containing protein [Blautia sp.]|nr:polyphosphate polymerase domain-containing protein [Blautia sp.]MDY3997824.1 polyphosphate polymerase domain-containing protein [Blautia sp.]